MNTLSKNILVSFLVTLLCTIGLFAEDTQVDFDAAKIQINGLQATDPTLPSGVAQPKGRVGDILSKLFGADGKIGTRFLGIFTPGTTTINSVYISGATLTNVNATTLGGQTAAYYTNANNFTTGTFSGGLLPSTVVQTIGTQTITGAKTFTDTLVINKGASDTVQVGSSIYLQGGGSSFTQLQQGVGRFTIWGFNGSTWGEKMTINGTSGNVGIGTLSPTQKLDVVGNIKTSGDIMASRICTSGGTGCVTLPFTASSIDGGGTASYVARFTDGNTLGTGSIFDNGTNVSIGTTPLVGYRLTVSGGIVARNGYVAVDGNNDSDYGYLTDGPGTGIGLASDFTNLSTPDLYILANGNLGIGTITPSQRLTVGSGNLLLTAGAIGIDSNNDGDRGWITNGGPGNGIGLTSNISRLTTPEFYIDGFQNVGIGTNTPTAKFNVGGGRPFTVNPSTGFVSVQGDNGGWAFRYGAFGSGGTDVGGYGFFGGGNALNRYYIGTYNTDEKISILDSNGNVGIGTTAPGYKLTVTSSGSANTLQVNSTAAAGQARINLNAGVGGVGQIDNSVGNFFLSNASIAGDMIFRVGTSVERMRIDSAGNVGIGTTTPLAKLAVNNFAEIGGANQNAYDIGAGRIAAGNSIYSYGSICTGNNSGVCTSLNGVVLGINNTSAFSNIPNGGNTFFNATSGNVGIGTTTPTSKLQVNGNIATNGDLFTTNTSPTTYFVDSDGRSAMAHVNSNYFYLLRGSGIGSTSWAAINGRWPLAINLETNDALFGGDGDFGGNVAANGTAFIGDGKTVIQFDDAWLRLNSGLGFTNGTYTPGLLRADGGLQVGGNGSLFLVNSTTGNVGIGTTAPVTQLDVRGATNIDQGPSYDVWVQGGSSTAGATRNLALLGVKSNDSLHLNYAGEYAGGTVIGSNVSIAGGNLTVSGNNIQTGSYCNTAGTNCKNISQMSEPDAMVASGTALISAIQAAANLPSGSPTSAAPDFWSYGGYYMINTRVLCTGRVEGGNITAPKRYHPIVKVNGTVSGTANGFWWEDMETVCLTRWWGPHEIHIKVKLEGNATTISGATGGFQWELWED